MSKKTKTTAEESAAEEKAKPQEEPAAMIPPILSSAAASMIHAPQEGWVSLATLLRKGIGAVKPEGGKAKAQSPSANLQELVLDYKGARYKVVHLAAAWARVLRRQEENRHLTPNEILQRGLRDVLSGEVDWEKLKSAGEAPAPLTQVEEPAKEGKSR